jgi:hypothetical protein
VIKAIDGRECLRVDLRVEIKVMSKGAAAVSRGLELCGAERSEVA